MFLKGAIRSGTKGRRTAIFAATMVALMSVPAILYAFVPPPAGLTDAPPNNQSCASCHGGLTTLSGFGVTFPSMTYTPGGAAETWTVNVPTGAPGGGYELSTQFASDNTQAGTLAAGDANSNELTSTVVISSTATAAIQYVREAAQATSYTITWTPPPASPTPGNVVVYVTGVGSSFGSGTYAQSYTLTPAAVTTTPTLSTSPTPQVGLSFTVNAAEPADQTISVTSSGSAIAVTASSATTPTGGSWLSIMPPGGNTPLTETVHIVATGLAAGTYNGSVSFASTGASNSPVSVPVTLTVTNPIPVSVPTLDLNSGGLNFTATAGGTASPQSVMVTTSTGSAVTFNVAPTSTGNWLTVGGSTGTSTGTTPVSESIGVVLTGLAANTYTGSVTFTSSGVSNTTVTLPVTLTVNSSTPPPPPTGLPWSFNTDVVDRQAAGTDYMLITGNGGMNSTNQLSGSGSFTRFQSLTPSTPLTSGRGPSAASTSAPTSAHPVVANGRWRVTGLTSSNLTTRTTTNSSGVTTTRVSGGTATLAVSITISGCNSGGGESEGGAPAPTASPITGSLTVTSNGGGGSGISFTYNGTCISTSSTGTTTSNPISGSFTSVGIGTYSLGGGGDN